MLPPSLFASRSVVGANLFTALLYGPISAMFTLLPFVMIRGAELSVFIVGFAFIPVQVVMTIVSPLAGMLCRRFGRRTPLLAGAIVTAFACLAALRIDERSLYLPDIFPAVLLLAIGMSLAIAPLTTLVLTTVEVDYAGAAAGVNAAVSRAGSLLAVALLGGVLRGGGSELIAGFHTAMVWSAVVSVLAALSVSIVEPGPHVDFIPRD
jgi:predicted MFS family arabinose efflux permease